MTTAIEMVNNELDTQRQRVTDAFTYWDEHSARMLPVLEAMEEHIIYMSPTSYDLNITVSGDYAVLLKCLRAFRSNGFMSREVPEKGQGSFSTYFRDRRDDGTDRSDAKFFFTFSSTQCRQVKVGTKMVQQDVYEIICDEEPQA
jgi:hypothetical protein